MFFYPFQTCSNGHRLNEKYIYSPVICPHSCFKEDIHRFACRKRWNTIPVHANAEVSPESSDCPKVVIANLLRLNKEGLSVKTLRGRAAPGTMSMLLSTKVSEANSPA